MLTRGLFFLKEKYSQHYISINMIILQSNTVLYISIVIDWVTERSNVCDGNLCDGWKCMNSTDQHLFTHRVNVFLAPEYMSLCTAL